MTSHDPGAMKIIYNPITRKTKFDHQLEMMINNESGTKHVIDCRYRSLNEQRVCCGPYFIEVGFIFTYTMLSGVFDITL